MADGRFQGHSELKSERLSRPLLKVTGKGYSLMTSESQPTRGEVHSRSDHVIAQG
jgi:hypothetical protein